MLLRQTGRGCKHACIILKILLDLLRRDMLMN
jgi:hypothetical protein